MLNITLFYCPLSFYFTTLNLEIFNFVIETPLPSGNAKETKQIKIKKIFMLLCCTVYAIFYLAIKLDSLLILEFELPVEFIIIVLRR